METVEIIALNTLILSLLLLLKVFSLQRQLNEIKSDLEWPNNRPEAAALPKQTIHMPISPVPTAHAGAPANLDERLLVLIASGKRIQAIKAFREASGQGLLEAKNDVDNLERKYN
ncbi:hypothetical protein [Paenibacillus sinopodophylli]|uniref:hypothetical protein n=1 Tax=Paenibacillus sinopodophylli TaxID=1837342 RepID=UPI00110C9D9A|nr:hypothetical protein [Paenibacillus sinopodophylli]